MPSDRSRTSDDLRQQYQGVVLQQGRVILDRDFNELQTIVNDEIAADALQEIGPSGAHDDGFLVGLATEQQQQTNPWDFSLGAGTYFVGGQRAALPAVTTYFTQPDWIKPDPPDGFGKENDQHPALEAVYLHLFEQEVSAVEDPDLLDVALGGPDTTQRLRLMRRVKRAASPSLECDPAWEAVIALWANKGYHFDPTTMRLEPLVHLEMRFAATRVETSPCDPAATGGFLGAENQTIRVQIAEPGADGKGRLLWGYDNASFLYRVSSIQVDGKNSLVLDQPPVDAYHTLKKGQIVEVLRSGAKLPDGGDLPGNAVVRRVAEATGKVVTVANFNAANKTVEVTESLAGFSDDPDPLFLRVWQGQLPFDPTLFQPLNDPTGATSPGLQVKVTRDGPVPNPPGAALPIGSFWIFSVRPSSPQAIYPERYKSGPQPPDGPRQWLARLGTLQWDHGAELSKLTPASRVTDHHDCRPHFDNLVELSQRLLGGCCTITVKPTDAPRLQSMIDSAVSDNLQAKICFTPGTYLLTSPLRLAKRHSGLVLESCQSTAILQAHADSNPGLFLDGLIVLVGANSVTVRNLYLVLPPVRLDKVPRDRLEYLAHTPLASLMDTVQTMVGIRPVQSANLTVDSCVFNYSPETAIRTFGVGIFVAGDCSDLRVERCQFLSTVPATSTPTGRPLLRDTILPVQPAAGDVPTPAPTTSVPAAPTPPEHAPAPAAPAEPAPAATAPVEHAPAPSEPAPAPPAPVEHVTVPPAPAEPANAAPAHGEPVPAPAPTVPAAPESPEPSNTNPNLNALHLGEIPPIASAPPAPTALCGIAVLPFIEPVTDHEPPPPFQAVLHDAVIVDNDFTNLMLGMATWCDLGKCRLQNNRVTACLAGFWLASQDANVPPAAAPLFAFVEIALGGTLGPAFPLPVEFDAAAARNAPHDPVAPTPCHMDVANNCINTLLDNAKISSAALALSLVRKQAEAEEISAIVANNDIRGRSNAEIPLFAISSDAKDPSKCNSPATLTGNVIVNDLIKSPSLLIFRIPDNANEHQQRIISRLAVTGNVLVGTTNLKDLTRYDMANAASPFDTWVPFNSTK